MGPKTGQVTSPLPEFAHTVPPTESEYSSYGRLSVPFDMKRFPPAACIPVSRPTVTPVEPLVHSTVTLVLTSSAVVLLATTGSYDPKFRSVAPIVQLAVTSALTVNVLVFGLPGLA